MGLGEQLLVELRLGEEVGVPGLQVEDDVETSGRSRVDPRPDVVERALQRVVAVGPASAAATVVMISNVGTTYSGLIP